MGMLAEARKTLPIALVQGVAEKLPLADGCADFVTMGYALRHVIDLESTFREYLRVLKPGGRLVILEVTRPATGSAAYRFTRFYLQTVVPLRPCSRRRHFSGAFARDLGLSARSNPKTSSARPPNRQPGGGSSSH